MVTAKMCHPTSQVVIRTVVPVFACTLLYIIGGGGISIDGTLLTSGFLQEYYNWLCSEHWKGYSTTCSCIRYIWHHNIYGMFLQVHVHVCEYSVQILRKAEKQHKY